jgi:outer membrane protein
MQNGSASRTANWTGQRNRVGLLLLTALLASCQNETPNVDVSIAAYRDRMLVQHKDETPPPPDVAQPLRRDPVIRPASGQPEQSEKTALLSAPPTTSQPAPEDVLAEVPDPVAASDRFQVRLERLRAEQAGQQDQRVVRNFDRVAKQAVEYLNMNARPKRIELGLAECVQRAISNNYTIRIEAHNPAITQTQVVEAEAAFDAQFFLDTQSISNDPATLPGNVPQTSDQRAVSGGIRKLLPTGMQASVGLGTSRVWSGLPQGNIKVPNPTWPSNFVVDLRQPLLRGFGLDVNRAQIDVQRLNYGISYEQFLAQVRDTLLDVETAYWNLMQARRRTTVFAETVAQYLITYQNMVERLPLDATQVEVENSKSRWQSQYVSYLETLKLVRDAEDQLKNLLNDPELLLSDQIEIVPVETPFVAPLVLDHFAEVRTALDRRAEVQQARKRIESARVGANVAKNAILPQLDLRFQYETQGLGGGAGTSWDVLVDHNFISYTVGVSLTYNFGERAARAQYRRARLQESQAVVALNQALDAIVQEVNLRVRTLAVRYAQLPPSLESVISAERNLRALQARTQRIDPSYLQTELSAVEQLGSTRTTLLQVITDYNLNVVQLERAKGTLLEYNNIRVVEAKSER